MVDLSDLVPTLAVVAPFATRRRRIRGVGFIRAKESDRLGDLCAELRRAGVDATETDDGLVVEPGAPARRALQTHHDHRLAMAFGAARARRRRRRDRRSRRGIEELARVLGRCSRSLR